MTEEKVQNEDTKEEFELSDEETLFPEREVEGIIVKPWSFGKLFKVSGKLEAIINKLEERKILDLLSGEIVSYADIANIFTTAASEEVLEIIALTLDRPKEEIEELSMETGVKIAMVIFYQNKKTIKNALAPLFKVMTNPKK